MHTIGLGPAAQLLEVAIETFELGEEPDIEAEPIEQPDGVVRIDGRHQAIARIGDRLEMPRRDEAGHSGDCEVFGRNCHHAFPFTAAAATAVPLSAVRSTASSRGAVTRSE